MKTFLFASAVCGLALTIIAPILCFAGTVDLAWSRHLMTVGMILWFAGDVRRVVGRRHHQ